MQAIEIHEVNGYTVELHFDHDPLNPREWDNLGIMLCGHPSYELGDEQVDTSRFSSWSEINEWLHQERGALVSLPLRLYDHSGLSMSTNMDYPYNDRWDSMTVGFIYTTKERCDYIGVTNQSPEHLKKLLRDEVDIYNDYLTGQVFGFVIKDAWDEVRESIWGYYGLAHCREEALDMARSMSPPNVLDRAQKSFDTAIKAWARGG